MPYPSRLVDHPRLQRLRANLGPRAGAILLTLLLELLLALVLLTLKPEFSQPGENESTTVFTMDAESPAPPEAPAEPASEPRPVTPPAETSEPQPDRPDSPPSDTPPVEAPTALPPPIITLPREQMASADIARPPAPAAPPARRPTYGPVDSGPSGPPDTERVGTAPNGQPLYAAAWYREPYDSELRGYLSTASGPGWGLIACRTVANYRVEDCVGLGESPEGSQITRAVLAAAWQFKVRPPRLGGEYRVGEWVRIRIDYGVQRRRN